MNLILRLLEIDSLLILVRVVCSCVEVDRSSGWRRTLLAHY